MNTKASKLLITGLLAVICYFLFTTGALIFYQGGSFSPLINWLSDLGNTNKNPMAWIYNLGILLTSAFLVLFFIGFRAFRMEHHRIQKVMVAATQMFGIMGSIAMAMSAVFPINHVDKHRFFSISLYILLGTAFVFSVAALRYWKNIPLWILIIGGATAVTDIFSSFFGQVTWLEWVVVVLFLVYLLSLSIVSAQQQPSEQVKAAPVQ